MRKSSLIVVLVLAVLLLVVETHHTNNEQAPYEESDETVWVDGVGFESGFEAAVSYVIDGDTVRLENGEKVRIIGLDAPEVNHPTIGEECYGVESMDYARQLLEGQVVVVELDESQGERDTYGRLLAHILLPDGSNFSERMISAGYAEERTYNGWYKYQTNLRTAEDTARAGSVGLWGECE